jgi:phosphate transport system substrate-binding protein
MNRITTIAIATFAAASLALTGCDKPGGSGGNAGRNTIKNVGSDTMLQLGMAWSEAYSKANPGVNVEVNGGGSGVGIAGLVNGSVELASASRKVEDKEVEELKTRQNKEPKEFMVGYDALSIYVHKDNPLNEISLEELGEIYKKDGRIRKWSDLGVNSIPGARGDEIIVISRQNNSGTQHYFKEAVIGKKSDQRPDTLNQNGSADVVKLVGTTQNAIGYSGMGYKTAEVKVLKISKKKGEPAVAPSVGTALDKTYPISRPMFMYTAGEPAPHVKAYIDWIGSAPGQEILKQQGYVPLETGK